jgi:3-hydroxybutyryl-CoA dehydrogenase
MALSTDSVIGVVGAGAMGAGIAQVAAAAGHRVVLGDVAQGAVARAQASMSKGLDGLVAKGKMTRDDADALLGRIDWQWESIAESLSAYRPCQVVIEAIVEDLGTKRSLFQQMETIVGADAILATNTSSLSVTSIASACQGSRRVLGLHFFNPPPVMALVEVIPGATTDPLVATQAYALMERWGKRPVLASDTPGFIVNRIARPFYGEALRIAEEGIADYATIDWAMRELGKFRMGPFELMDFIGNDVNFAVTRSVYEAFFHEPRYRPSLTQKRLVDAGLLGRKSGRGYYDYAASASKPEPTTDPAIGMLVLERVLAMLINEAADAVLLRVASPEDIDLAMTKGVNYPKGLLAWADEIGVDRVHGWLRRLHDDYGEDRYRPSPLLRRMAVDGRRFFS